MTHPLERAAHCRHSVAEQERGYYQSRYRAHTLATATEHKVSYRFYLVGVYKRLAALREERKL